MKGCIHHAAERRRQSMVTGRFRGQTTWDGEGKNAVSSIVNYSLASFQELRRVLSGGLSVNPNGDARREPEIQAKGSRNMP